MKLLELVSSHMQKALTFTSYTQGSVQTHRWPTCRPHTYRVSADAPLAYMWGLIHRGQCRRTAGPHAGLIHTGVSADAPLAYMRGLIQIESVQTHHWPTCGTS